MKPNVAIVTGAARGIGLAISDRLAGAGWRVVGLDRAWGATPSYFAACEDADVTDFEQLGRVIENIEQNVGPVGALVNNAGITRDAVCHKMEPADFRRVIEVNLIGTFNLCRLVLPQMRNRSFGRIVSMSSMNGLRGQIGQANYAAAKAGLVALTKSIALENASKGITANCIAPGFIETDMTAAMKPAVKQAEIAAIPAGRIGQPADVAAAALFLVSDDAAFITGQVLSVNGGQLMP